MVDHISTDTAPPPFSNYSQGTKTNPGAAVTFVSGQVGVDVDGNLAGDEAAQHEQCWRNILAILAADGLDAGDILDVRGYVTGASGVAIFRETRDRMLDGARPCSTLLIVSGLAHPDWLVEISVVAQSRS